MVYMPLSFCRDRNIPVRPIGDNQSRSKTSPLRVGRVFAFALLIRSILMRERTMHKLFYNFLYVVMSVVKQKFKLNNLHTKLKRKLKINLKIMCTSYDNERDEYSHFYSKSNNRNAKIYRKQIFI